MIFTDRTITVRKGESRIDEPIVVYRGDYELEVRFTILNSKFRFMSGTNLIESEKASYGQLAILTPYGGNIFSDIVGCNDGSVTFVLTAEMLNQIEEVGLYSFQIRLMDYNKESRVSIPPIEFGIEVREPIASEDHDNSVNNAIVGYSIAKVVDPKEENVGDTFDGDGNYNKTKWETGDRISQGKLNKIEDAIDKLNKNEMNNSASLSKRIDNNFNVLGATKADVTKVDNVQTQLDNLVLGAVGDGNNAEVVQARGDFNLLNTRLDDSDRRVDRAARGEIALSIIEDAIHFTGYITIDNNITSHDPHYVYTNLLGVSPGDIIDYAVHSQKEVWIFQFFDENEEFISGISTTKGFYELTRGTAVVPQNAKYVRCSWANSIDEGKTTVSDSYINTYIDLKNTMYTIQNDISELEKEFKGVIDLLVGVSTVGGYMSKDNVIVTDANWITTDFIDVREYHEVEVSYVTHKAVAPVTFYNSSKEKISNLVSSTNNVATTLNVTLPPNTSFIRVSSASPIYMYYSPMSIIYKYDMSMKDVDNRLDDLDSKITILTSSTLDILNESSITKGVGYLHTDGVSITQGDTNWFYTNYVVVTEGDTIFVEVMGHIAVGSICIYDANKNLTDIVSATSNGEIISKTISIAESGYIRISGGSESYSNMTPVAILYSSSGEVIRKLKNEIESLKNEVALNKVDISYISPYKVYTTCNDVGGRKGHNRNYASAIYLDHFFNGFTEEKNIRFENNSDKIVVFSPMMVTDSNESNPTVRYNEGVNILIKNKEYRITGNDIADSTFNFTHVSTLNSATANVTPRVLCIGDSITYAELAQVNDDDHSQNWAYHLMCKELFMKDNIDNGGSGYDIRFLGHYKKQRKMSYKDSDYDVITYHEGIRGISLSSYLNGGVNEFKSTTTNKFSLNAWLSKYRTLDDNGNRLTVGNGTGSLITTSNINSIDVCTPTHVLIMLGANGGGTLAQYKELVNIIKTEYPDMIIGLTIPDCAGTYFPSLHPNCDEKMTIWNDTGSQGSRHSSMHGLVSMLQEEFCTAAYENQNIYFLPFYFVQPTAESCSMRKVNLPCSEIRLTHDNIFNANYGWHASTHVNGIGHINWGYQLYSWLKYTIAKNK